jgi:hypothetical protein
MICIRNCLNPRRHVLCKIAHNGNEKPLFCYGDPAGDYGDEQFPPIHVPRHCRPDDYKVTGSAAGATFVAGERSVTLKKKNMTAWSSNLDRHRI